MLKYLLPIMAAFTMSTSPASADHSERHIHMVKNQGCGCCTVWAEIARENGFEVTVEETLDYAGTKKKFGVPFELAACHSSTMAGYVVEGHVPMNALEKLLAEKPKIHGITVPGMPAGSPGMGYDPKAKYDILSFQTGEKDSAKIFYKAGQ